MDDIGWARIGAEISWGSSSLASAATFLSDPATLDGFGALAVVGGGGAGFVKHDTRSTHNSTGENRIQISRC